jgi:hypothetical protein
MNDTAVGIKIEVEYKAIPPEGVTLDRLEKTFRELGYTYTRVEDGLIIKGQPNG